MWEYTIKCGMENQPYIEYIYNRIVCVVVDVNGQLSMASTDTERILSVAIPEEYQGNISRVLRLLLCDVFCEKMKFDYIKDNWCYDIDNSFLEILIRVCTYFDIELERKIFMQNFNFTNSIMLDTYLDFCFGSLKQKWCDLVNLVNNNADIFFQDENFFEILSFLVLNLGTKQDKVVLKVGNDDDIILEFNKMYVIYNKNDLVGIISKLIELSPKSLVVHMPNCDTYSIDKVVQLFGKKVVLC